MEISFNSEQYSNARCLTRVKAVALVKVAPDNVTLEIPFKEEYDFTLGHTDSDTTRVRSGFNAEISSRRVQYSIKTTETLDRPFNEVIPGQWLSATE
jgi:hypothetical protein